MFRVRTAITGGPGGSELNTLYFGSTLTLTAQHAADATRAFWYAISNKIHTAYTMQVEPEVTEIADFTGHPIGVHTTVTAPVPGTDSGQPLPPATQGLVKFQTGIYYNGRQLQGKLYVPGPTENLNTTGVPLPVYITDIAAAATTMIADPNSDLLVFSRKNLNANGVTGASVWSQWAILKSRRS